MSHLILSSSLNPNSKSRVLGQAVASEITRLGKKASFIDLRDHPLPFCDGGAAYGHPNVGPLTEMISTADSITIASPIYNYDVNAVIKNLIELTGKAWTGKRVGCVLAAGGDRSYMGVLGITNSLMIDFRCHIIPRFVYASASDFAEDGSPSPAIVERTNQFSEDITKT
ncbi:NAD(P)H-dependent oxidoreductase [bacterium]|jgi:NAD(P)H-dependent FMN reductase|nr:NAD(P)H-dependent oxidoreductase [bacterium]